MKRPRTGLYGRFRSYTPCLVREDDALKLIQASAWSFDMRMKVLFAVQNNCETQFAALASVLCYPNVGPASTCL